MSIDIELHDIKKRMDAMERIINEQEENTGPVFSGFVGYKYGPVDGYPPYMCDICSHKDYGIVTLDLGSKKPFMLCQSCCREIVNEMLEVAFEMPGAGQ